jgi:hypothetical protein
MKAIVLLALKMPLNLLKLRRQLYFYNQIGKDLGPASYWGFSIFVDLSLPLA